MFHLFMSKSLNSFCSPHMGVHINSFMSLPFIHLECPLECQNGGKLDAVMCTCACLPGYVGLDCSG